MTCRSRTNPGSDSRESCHTCAGSSDHSEANIFSHQRLHLSR